MLHILLDRSGAYLALEYSLVCSHLESLIGRIEKNSPRRVEDPAKWAAYHAGELEAHIERVIGGRPVELKVKRTNQWLIMTSQKA